MNEAIAQNLGSLKDFLPETILTLGVMALFLLDLVWRRHPKRTAYLTGAMGLILLLTADALGNSPGAPRELFNRMIVNDGLGAFFQWIFLATTAYTAAVSLVFGLNKALELIHAEGLERVYARHALMAESVRAAGAALGLRLVAPENPAPGVTGLLAPDGIDTGKVVKYMRDTLGVSIQGGQDQMKGKLVRIGHMGNLAPFDMLVAVGALEIALKYAGMELRMGAGVAAVQALIARGV
jgi:selenocysteine lyase/cysteine desulfurase